MGYDYYEDDYEPTVEEMEEQDGMENTDVVIGKESLRIEFNTENFAAGIMRAVAAEVKKSLYGEIVKEIKKEVLDDIKKKVQCATGDIIKDIVLDFLNNDKICVGGSSVWDDEPKEELTLYQYAKRCTKDCIENSRFRIAENFKKDRYGKYKAETQEYSFEEVRQQVNRDVKAAFDESTKTMLSNAVLQVLMANDTYKKIENNIACIADKAQD